MSTRWFAGIHVTADCRRIEAALVGVHGRGDGAPIESRGGMSFDLPREIVERFEEFLAMEKSHPPQSYRKRAEAFARISTELTTLQEEAFEELIAESQLPKHEVLALGVLDPGVWDIPTSAGSSSTGEAESCESGPFRVFRAFSNPEFLAERTGMTVVDSFSSRDIACGGTGGPLFPFPTWIVLCSEEKERVLLDLGRSAKWTYLPRPGRNATHEQIEYGEILPCGALFEAGTLRATRSRGRIDEGGVLTASGRCRATVLKRWESLWFSSRGDSRELWTPGGLSVEPYLEAFENLFATENATHHGESEEASSADFLATCVSLITEAVATELEDRFLKSPTKHPAKYPMEILITGGTLKNKPFKDQLFDRLQSWTCKPISECGVSVESLEAVGVAILTLLFVDQIPAAIPGITGAQTVQPLGRITPGNPRSWSRFLEEISQSRSASRPLRSTM